MKTAIELVQDECLEQEKKHKYSAEHDDAHVRGELALAAICYALPKFKGEVVFEDHNLSVDLVDELWPWGRQYYKRSQTDETKNLVKAAALLIKEIERRQRRNSPEQKEIYIGGKIQIEFDQFGMP